MHRLVHCVEGLVVSSPYLSRVDGQEVSSSQLGKGCPLPVHKPRRGGSRSPCNQTSEAVRALAKCSIELLLACRQQSAEAKQAVADEISLIKVSYGILLVVQWKSIWASYRLWCKIHPCVFSTSLSWPQMTNTSQYDSLHIHHLVPAIRNSRL